MEADLHPTAARGFARAALSYRRGRPSYPAGAVGWLAERLRLGPGTTVVDLGAGTGALTRALLPWGAEIIAVEPVAEMRRVLGEDLAGVRVLDGTAETIPLPDASVDAVTVGQAFHWFDGAAALAEIARVLRPGGRLGLIWNSADPDDPLQRAMTELVHRHRPPDVPAQASQAWREAFGQTALFTPLEAYETRLEQELDADGYADRVASTSYIAALDEATRRDVLAEARRIVAGQPPRFTVRYRTYAFACRRETARQARAGGR